MSTQQYPHPNAIDVMGRLCLEDERGAYFPLSQIAPAELLEDELVGKLLGFAKPLSAELARLKAKSFGDVEAFLGLLAQDYNVDRRTKKGNLTLFSYDRRRKVEIKSSDRIVFGPQLQMAKAKVDECLRKWGATIDPRLQAIINSAFDVDREGAVRPARILLLRRAHITDDPDWDQAMRAIDDAMRVVGTSFYMLFRERIGDTDSWNRISLNFADVELTPEAEAAFSPRRELAMVEDTMAAIRAELARSPSKFPDDVDLATAVAWLVDQQYDRQGELELQAQEADDLWRKLSTATSALVRINDLCAPDYEGQSAEATLARQIGAMARDGLKEDGVPPADLRKAAHHMIVMAAEMVKAASHLEPGAEYRDLDAEALHHLKGAALYTCHDAPGESGEVIEALPPTMDDVVGEQLAQPQPVEG